jgi:spore germination protein GerM
MSLRRRVALIAGLCWLVAGCGVPTDPVPRDIPAGDVPFGLVNQATTTTAAAAARSTPSARAEIYLVKRDRLARVERSVAAPATPATVLAALAAGPTPQEAATGLRSALISNVAAVEASAGTATMTLAADITAPDIREQILALAQLVYTVTALRGITGARFVLDDRPTEVPTAQGSVKAGIITRADYATVAPVR